MNLNKKYNFYYIGYLSSISRTQNPVNEMSIMQTKPKVLQVNAAGNFSTSITDLLFFFLHSTLTPFKKLIVKVYLKK